MSKKTLVIGASDKPDRYSNLALKFLKKHKHQAIGLAKKSFEFEGIQVYDTPLAFQNIHTVTLYLNPVHQNDYKDYILSLKAKRVIFNPGAENKSLQTIFEQNDILCLNACTLVLLQTGQY